MHLLEADHIAHPLRCYEPSPRGWREVAGAGAKTLCRLEDLWQSHRDISHASNRQPCAASSRPEVYRRGRGGTQQVARAAGCILAADSGKEGEREPL